MNKRGQSGANSAILVALMALAIILYILFLPPDVREDLLDGNRTQNGGSGDSTALNLTLLHEKPGTISYVDFGYRNHELPSFRLYSADVGSVLKEQDSIYLKNSAFEKKFATISFKAENPGLKNFLLSFNVEKAKGRLLINLNGQNIFDRALSEGSPLPIKLPQDLIKEENILEFQASQVGFAVWSYNQYLLKNIKVTADYTDTSAGKSTHRFFISKEEKENLESATVFFFPRCSTEESGLLTIDLNNARIYSSIADCGVNNNIPVGTNHLYEGENTIEFKASKGSYLVDNLRVRTYIKKPAYPIYYFNIKNDFFRSINDNDPEKDEFKEKYEDVILKIRFANEEAKKADIIINGYPRIHLDTRQLNYERTIKGFVYHGANSIEISPKTTLNIVELKIIVKEKN